MCLSFKLQGWFFSFDTSLFYVCVCVCVGAHKYLWLNFHHYCDNDTQTEKNVLASSSFLGGTFIPNCVFCALGLFVPCGHLSLWVLTKLSSDVHPSSCCTCGEVAFREFCECVSFRWGKESSQLPPPRGGHLGSHSLKLRRSETISVEPYHPLSRI